MKLFGLEITRVKQTLPQKRHFNASSTGTLYANWIPVQATADVSIRRDLRSVRNRSRDLMMNDDYAKRFKRILKTNVIGSTGLRLQNRAKDTNGNLDRAANNLIEEAWKEWGKKGICDVTGKYTIDDVWKMAIGAAAEDGEVLIRKVKGFPNKFGFAVQLIEADHLDEQFNDPERNIMMGIEFDAWGKPIAYHIYKSHPHSNGMQRMDIARERIPADQIVHLFLPTRISSSRGMPWMHTAMTRMKMLNGYEEAELVASRVAASKGGFYKRIKNESGEFLGDEKIDGGFVNELSPGEFEILPDGYEFQSYDPTHPTTAFKDFIKVVLRGVSSGLDISYNSLANDLEGVNFSSLRSGKLEERDIWKELQQWMIDHAAAPVFGDWLDMALLKQAVPLPYSKYEKFNAPSFLGRGFAWVDPYKDMLANILAKKEGLKTDTQIANEMGMDLEELYQQLQKEKKLREQYGILTMSEAEIAQIMTVVIQSEQGGHNDE